MPIRQKVLNLLLHLTFMAVALVLGVPNFHAKRFISNGGKRLLFAFKRLVEFESLKEIFPVRPGAFLGIRVATLNIEVLEQLATLILAFDDVKRDREIAATL